MFFKNHPKGLIPAALANMGERFGFYTMMAILVLFLMAKLGIDNESATKIYSIFYFFIYVLAFVGGLIADRTRKYKATILSGLALMTLGYIMLAVPSATPVPEASLPLIFTITCLGLFVIAFGNGLFKGNLQALVGQMYDAPQYSKMRDNGFSIFYMFINIGGIFAPIAASSVREWWLRIHNFAYDANLLDLSNGFLKGNLSPEAITNFQALVQKASLSGPVENYTEFANSYINVFTTGFHYSFAIAACAMIISMIVFVVSKKGFPTPKLIVKGVKGSVDAMDIKEVKQRIWALIAVYAVVIFFWFAFHQNGVTLTLFAKDYTHLEIFGSSFAVELFQSLNPFFVVFLTPIVIAFFGFLRAKGFDLSAPKKIAIGMAICAAGFLLMSIGSASLPNYSEVEAMGGLTAAMKVSPLLLFGTYFILTVAELFISPLGISFVSKVAPPQYQGLMQGGWLAATAVGNLMLFLGTVCYNTIPLWATWGVFVGVSLCSMILMICMLKWLERVAK